MPTPDALADGRRLLDLGRADDAATAFGLACEHAADAVDARLGLAVALVRAGRVEEAAPHLDQIATASPAARLLRAHVLRRLGDRAGAAADFWAVAATGRDLTPPDRLAFAEVLFNDGQPAAALEQLRGVDPADPRGRLLTGAAEQALGRPQPALEHYRAAGTDGAVGRQARRRLLTLIGRRPDLPGAALDAWPERSRDELFWVVSGNAARAAGRYEDAVRAWAKARRPAGARFSLADHYNAGNDARVLELVREWGPADGVAPVAVAALTRLVLTRWRGGDLLATLAEVERLASSPETRLLAGFLRAAADDPAGAERALLDHPARPTADHLRGWSRVREAHRLRLADRAAEARPLLAEARELWPRAAAHLDGKPEPGRAPRLADAADRERTRLTLEACADAAGPADPLACHNLAVYHLSEAARSAALPDWPAVLDHARRAVAYFGVVLTNPWYRDEWAARRAAVYGTDPPAQDVFHLERRATEFITAAFGRWATAAQEQGAAEAAALADLGFALRAESHGARQLRDAGGLTGPAGAFSAGAGYLELKGHGGLLPAALAAVPDPTAREELARLFSPHRVSAVLAQEGSPAEALARLRRSLPPGGGGPTVQGLEVELLLKCGEQEVSSPTGDIDAGVRSWLEAIELAPAAERREATAAAVREAALARARGLEEEENFDAVVRLLSGVLETCGDGRMRGVLSGALVARGVAAGNAKRWPESVADLRRACELNEHSQPARKNLVIALQWLAAETRWADHTRAVALLEEAIAAAQGVTADDDEWQKLVAQLPDDLRALRGG